jgi:hypothetical protein
MASTVQDVQLGLPNAMKLNLIALDSARAALQQR